jgi:hypothetical protein
MTEMKPGDFAAFPIQASDAQGSLYAEQGLTKREYLAATVMQGLCAAIDDYAPNRILDHKGIAQEAVQLADALLIALASQPGAEGER